MDKIAIYRKPSAKIPFQLLQLAHNNILLWLLKIPQNRRNRNPGTILTSNTKSERPSSFVTLQRFLLTFFVSSKSHSTIFNDERVWLNFINSPFASKCYGADKFTFFGSGCLGRCNASTKSKLTEMQTFSFARTRDNVTNRLKSGSRNN